MARRRRKTEDISVMEEFSYTITLLIATSLLGYIVGLVVSIPLYIKYDVNFCITIFTSTVIISFIMIFLSHRNIFRPKPQVS